MSASFQSRGIRICFFIPCLTSRSSSCTSVTARADLLNLTNCEWLLGRLAVDRHAQGGGVGAGLLKDAVLRVLQAAEHLAVRGILVDAIDAHAKEFYERFGFRASPSLPMKLMITIEEAERAVAALR